MLTHVALLRGVNLGGHNKLAMADLRDLAGALGWERAGTYLQSGNVVFAAGGDPVALADRLAEAVAGRLGRRVGVVVLARADLAGVIAANPFAGDNDPRQLHAVFRRGPLSDEDLAGVDAARQRAQARGSPDEAAVVGATLYVRTPSGFGRSELAAQLSRTAAGREGTARNWATVTNLMALLDA